MIVGIETDVDPKHGKKWLNAQFVSPLQIVQWTMAAAPNHPVVLSAIESMTTSLATKSTLSIRTGDPIYLTGPGPWTFAVYNAWENEGINWNFLRNFGNRSRLIGDILVLPTTGFA